MERRGRILLGLVVTALLAPASASAQSSPCAVYPQLCPTTTVTTTVTTPAVTSAGGVQPAATTEAGPERDFTDADGHPLPDEAKGAGPAAARGGAGPVLVGGARRGCGGIAVLHLGEYDAKLQEDIEKAVGEPMWTASLYEPVKLKALAGLLKSTRFADLGDGDLDLVGSFGRRIGKEAVTPTSLLRRIRTTLFEHFEGRLGLPSAIILARDFTDLQGDERSVRNRLASSIIAGLRREQIPTESGGLMPIPIPGTERSTDTTSDIKYFIDKKVAATVDNVDQLSGRNTLNSLVIGQTGHYGVKDTATSLSPARYDGPRPIRCRTAPSVTIDPTSARSPMTSGVVAMLALLLLLGAWVVTHSGRRTIRRRLQDR